MRNGVIAIEIGFDQKEALIDLINSSGQYKEVYCKKDLFQNDRVIVCKKR